MGNYWILGIGLAVVLVLVLGVVWLRRVGDRAFPDRDDDG